ncbi:hypothetical protein [Halalkalibacter oceani]|uniref:hypothetical protein n=1 Tax=Halalkalibacter oceani TaxID=1653776 RepID=UPI00339179D2
MGYSNEEQETVLVFNRVTDKWDVYSCCSPHITKLVNTYGMKKFTADYEEGREAPLSLRGTLEANQVSFRKGEKRKRELSPEQLEAQRERVKKMRLARKNKLK